MKFKNSFLKDRHWILSAILMPLGSLFLWASIEKIQELREKREETRAIFGDSITVEDDKTWVLPMVLGAILLWQAYKAYRDSPDDIEPDDNESEMVEVQGRLVPKPKGTPEYIFFMAEGVYRVWLIGGGWLLVFWIFGRITDYFSIPPHSSPDWWVLFLMIMGLLALGCLLYGTYGTVHDNRRRPDREKIRSLEKEIKELESRLGDKDK
jgi:hypothetical protein